MSKDPTTELLMGLGKDKLAGMILDLTKQNRRLRASVDRAKAARRAAGKATTTKPATKKVKK